MLFRSDGRMFPRSDSSQTVVDCLMTAAREYGVRLVANCGVTKASRHASGGFRVTLANGEELECGRLLLALGGCRTAAAGDLAIMLGHTLAPPVPSLFAFQVAQPALNQLAGIAVEDVEVSVAEARLKGRGPLLVTHTGLSGPAILRLSAWGARALHELDYRFRLQINWLPQYSLDALAAEIRARRAEQAARLVSATPLKPLPARLWNHLIGAAGLDEGRRWAEASRTDQHRLVQQLVRTELPVTGKSLNKEEFVTCGGVRLNEVDFKTMESRIAPGLHFAGELLDIDGLTGGFNFQAAWTTGWIAGQALAKPDG